MHEIFKKVLSLFFLLETQHKLSHHTHPCTCGIGNCPSDQQKLLQRRLLTLSVREKETEEGRLTEDRLKYWRLIDESYKWESFWVVTVSHNSVSEYVYCVIPALMKNFCLHGWSQHCSSAARTEKKIINVHYVIATCNIFIEIWWIYFITCQKRTGLTLLCGKRLATT